MPVRGREPGRYGRVLQRLEQAQVLDGAVLAAEPLARRLVSGKEIRRIFHGDATGIPLHIIFTDLPLGAWWMAQYLDLFPDSGSKRAATRLVALGVVSAMPTAVSGWAEWALADSATRRVGIVHATVNGAATAVFATSWVSRVQGRHGLGARLARLGGVLLLAGAMLGGHMGSGRRATPSLGASSS